MAIRKPRIGVSACLLGEEVRYDGGHKRNGTLIDALGPGFEFVPVCPEVEVGMGTPREPLQLVSGERGMRMVTVQTGIDYTDRMNEWACRRLRELERDDIDGYVLKSGSPSCGLEVPGLFASALIASLASLPVIDEKHLEDSCARAEFISAVTEYRRLKRERRE
jgi:uncharacterized protein YbbK (DUF523 family)